MYYYLIKSKRYKPQKPKKKFSNAYYNFIFCTTNLKYRISIKIHISKYVSNCIFYLNYCIYSQISLKGHLFKSAFTSIDLVINHRRISLSDKITAISLPCYEVNNYLKKAGGDLSF